jgi:secondary thiamine-phosphate synthase enzyme
LKISYFEDIVDTHERIEVIDITDRLKKIIDKEKIKEGIMVISVPHTTSAISINENEPNLINDIIKIIKDLFKPDFLWNHNKIDDNAHAHLASVFIGNSRCVIIKDSRLSLGTWQRVLLIELDGPRRRRLEIEIIGE